jgi:hypothetical protein
MPFYRRRQGEAPPASPELEEGVASLTLSTSEAAADGQAHGEAEVGAELQELPDCPICSEPLAESLDDAGEDGGLFAPPCGHNCHRVCLACWARRCVERGALNSCPTCRLIFPFV